MRKFNLPELLSDMTTVEVIDELKYWLTSRSREMSIADALNKALNIIIRDFHLDTDVDVFASLPKKNEE